jgi:hypothetical protein
MSNRTSIFATETREGTEKSIAARAKAGAQEQPGSLLTQGKQR